MAKSEITQQIIKKVNQLPLELQKKVLEYTELLSTVPPVGVPMSELKQFFGAISKEDADMMQKAIEEDCEKVYPNEW